MIKHLYTQLFLILCIVASASSQAEISDDTANELLALSGITEMLEQFPAGIKAGLAQSRQQDASIPEAQYKALVASVDETVLPAEILGGIRSAVQGGITEEQSKQLLAWYKSDVGREITAAEEQASTPAAYEEIMANAQTLLANSEKVAFAQRLDELMGTTDMSVDIQQHTAIAVYSALVTVLKPEEPLDVAAVRAQIESAREQMRAVIQQVVIASYVYAYQNIDADKLQQYEDFLNEPAAEEFNTVVMESLSKGIEKSVSKWANALAPLFKEQDQSN